MAVVNTLWASLVSRAQAIDPMFTSLVLEAVLVIVILYVVVPVIRSVVRSAQTSARLEFPSDAKSQTLSGLLDVSQLPSLCSPIPYFGHLLGLQNDSARYINKVIASTAASIFTINIPFKRIIVAHPSMDRQLSRHTSETGLAQILAYVGPRVFSLGPKTIDIILDCDPRPLHKVEFGGADNLKALSERSGVFIWDEMKKMPARSEVNLAHWMFGLTVSATASAVWGVENPWRMDCEFAEEFMNLSETFDSLSRPLAWLTAPAAYKSRQFLSRRLREFHHEHRDARVNSVAHGINVVAHSDPDWETNPDYFNIEMVSALGLLATPSTLCVWLMRHLLSDPQMLSIITEEVQLLTDIPGETFGTAKLDLADVRTLCPWLVAAWYENLRLHMTGVPRLARNDFTLNLAQGEPLAVSQGDIFLLPMCTSNLDPLTWGPDAASFVPSRFITGDGELNNSLIRKVRAFGVAGNLCPGRVFGFEVAMMMVAGMLRNFEIKSLDGSDFYVPGVRRGFNVGFERYADDVKVALVRK